MNSLVEGSRVLEYGVIVHFFTGRGEHEPGFSHKRLPTHEYAIG